MALENGYDGTMWGWQTLPWGVMGCKSVGAEKPGKGRSSSGTQGLAGRAAHGTSSGRGEPLQVFRQQSVLMEVMIIMMVLIIACSSVFL